MDNQIIREAGRSTVHGWHGAMSLLFDICAYLWVEGRHGAIPPEWEYRPGADPSGELDELKDRNPWLYGALDEADTETIVHTGQVLNRYTDIIEASR